MTAEPPGAAIIAAMTERGQPSVDGSPACPFVAFDDDRDARADQPDHRHRCFAEAEPAPRAAAHQEAYCLSSAFPVCPTFQAWARREAARAKPGSTAPPEPPAAASVGVSRAEEWVGPARVEEEPSETPPRRNPPRDWAAPPPWATGAGAAAVAGASGGSQRSGDGDARQPSAADRPPGARPQEGQGLAGSAADRLARGGSIVEPDRPVPRTTGYGADMPSAAPDPELAGLVGGAAGGPSPAVRSAAAAGSAEPVPPSAARAGRRPSVSSTRSTRERGRERLPEHEHVQGHDGPTWERARRFEAYPTIKTRAGLGGLPGVPRIAVLAVALGIAALALFFLPALFGVGGDAPEPTPSPSAAVATPSPSPTPEPEPTPQVYVIKSGDTLSAIAREFGLTLDQLLEANKDTITNPNLIAVGDEIIIPVPPPDEVDGGSAESPEP
jgi:LysM repeat protein